MFPYWKVNLFLKYYGLRFIPLVGFCNPKTVEFTNNRSVLKVPLGRKTKNHLGAMYFGALNIGAELSIGIACVTHIEESGRRIDFLFKDYKTSFLKRAEGDVHFICEEVASVRDLIQETIKSGERVQKLLRGYAIVPSKNPDEKIMEFELTLSMKVRAQKTA